MFTFQFQNFDPGGRGPLGGEFFESLTQLMCLTLTELHSQRGSAVETRTKSKVNQAGNRPFFKDFLAPRIASIALSNQGQVPGVTAASQVAS